MIGPGPSSRGGSRRQVEHRRLEADGRRPAVEDQVDPAVEVGQDVLGPGRREAVRPVGARGGERLAASLDQAAGDRSRGAPHADGRFPAVTMSGISAGSVQDERQRPGPEPVRQAFAPRRASR